MNKIQCVLLLFIFGNIFCAPAGSAEFRKSRTTEYYSKNKSPIVSETVEFKWNGDNISDPMAYNHGEKEYREITGRTEDRYIGDNGRRDYRTYPVINYSKKKDNRKPEPKYARVKKPALPPTATSKKNSKFIPHKIKKGDTLFGLSRKYGCHIDTICHANNISRNSVIKIGMVLKIPCTNNTAKSSIKSSKKKYKKPPRFIWPVAAIKRVKKERSTGVKPLGIEIITSSNSVVRSAAAGVVKKIGTMRGYGRYIVVSHENRYVTIYARLARIAVVEGEYVKAGKILARTENNKNAVHFQIGRAGKPVDPLKYLPKKG